jgi:hypothetical protein
VFQTKSKNMLRMVVFACVASSMALSQTIDPKDAKILKEQRFNTGTGQHGSAFATEDGTIFKEETDANGNRIGQYSYIGDDGKVISVKYVAGKDGFRIIEGDHIRATGQDAAPFNAEIAEPVAQAAPAPVRVAPTAAPIVPQIRDFDYEEVEQDPNRNPFINPHDPTHRDFAFNTNGAKFEPKNPVAAPSAPLTGSLVPDCADCAGVNPFVNPFDASHGGQLAGHLAGHQAGFLPQQPAAPVRQALPAFDPRTTTPTPTRFFPPGQLKLNRFETGFNFDFES